jgi:hypothetical protein
VHAKGTIGAIRKGRAIALVSRVGGTVIHHFISARKDYLERAKHPFKMSCLKHFHIMNMAQKVG